MDLPLRGGPIGLRAARAAGRRVTFSSPIRSPRLQGWGWVATAEQAAEDCLEEEGEEGVGGEEGEVGEDGTVDGGEDGGEDGEQESEEKKEGNLRLRPQPDTPEFRCVLPVNAPRGSEQLDTCVSDWPHRGRGDGSSSESGRRDLAWQNLPAHVSDSQVCRAGTTAQILITLQPRCGGDLLSP